MFSRILLSFLLSSALYAQTVTAGNAKPGTEDSPAAASAAADPLVSANALLKGRKFADAAAAFKAIIEKNPTSAEAHAGLIRSLFNNEQFDEAEEAAKKAIAVVPQSAPVHAAYGDVYFRHGKLGEAEAEYKSALKLDSNSGRATWGMGRIYRVVSMNKRAKDVFAKAHELSPDDPQITRSWISSQSQAQIFSYLKQEFIKSSAQSQIPKETYNAILASLSEGKIWAPAKDVDHIVMPLETIVEGSTRITGFGLKVKINDGGSFLPKLDTGASGLVIGRKTAEKAGVIKLANSKFGGIGDSGPVDAYIGWAEKITIGQVEFRNCIVEVSSKKDIDDQSGLLGADVFDNYLITIDWKERQLKLASLPKDPAATAENEPHDRYIAPEMQSFTKVFRFGKDLVVPVIVSDKAYGLFIVDTGAFANNISPELAAQVTNVRYNDNLRVHGVNGYVKDVQSADKVILQFGGMRVRSDDITSIDFSSVSRSEGTEIAGFIGIRTLVQMKVIIDYRDGLIKFEPYEMKKAQD